jgi:hypothetical protein
MTIEVSLIVMIIFLGGVIIGLIGKPEQRIFVVPDPDPPERTMKGDGCLLWLAIGFLLLVILALATSSPA